MAEPTTLIAPTVSATPRAASTKLEASSSGGFLGMLLKYSDLGVAVAVVTVVVMMVLPLPSWVVSLLIIVNLSVALSIVVISMYTKEALELSIFPSLLLFTTLLRLAINISVTRLILLDGDAGSVIHAFGSIVVGGNVIVGLVVFLIIVIIQFVVITKGSERVAEVAARFTLDAMPGKQMAIDADLNAGQITDVEAKGRRSKIQREADFYGSMDGASKFVKGDAIAALVIVAINLLAGIAIGMLQQGMAFGEAVSTFSLLSIGDGLAAQIPALLISVATGIIVTRAAGADEGEGSNLGKDMANQLLAHPRALGIAAVVVAGFGLFPGMPTLPFLIISSTLGMLAWSLGQRQKKHRQELAAAAVAEATKELPPPVDSVQKALPLDTLELEIGYGLIPLVDENEGGELLKRVAMVRRQMASELGLVLAPIRIRDNVQLQSHEYGIKVKGVEVARSTLVPGSLLAMNPGDADSSLPGEQTTEPAFGLPALWVSTVQRDQAEAAGYTVVDHPAIIITHLTETIRRHAGELLSRQDVRTLLDHVKERTPAIVEDVVPEIVTIGDVHRVLQLILEEGISIRDLPTILETLADRGRITKDAAMLTEFCRQGLSRQISNGLLDPLGRLSVITVDPSLEQELADAVVQTADGSYLGLDPGRAELVVDAVREQIEKATELGYRPAVVCSPRIRRHLRALCAHAVPRLAVLSYNEILPTVQVDAVGSITLVHEGSVAA